MPTNSLSPSGDDEELKGLLNNFADSARLLVGDPKGGCECHECTKYRATKSAVESLFGRIREAALTPEEAELLLWELDRDEEHPYFTFSGYSALTAKLRFISGGALKGNIHD